MAFKPLLKPWGLKMKRKKIMIISLVLISVILISFIYKFHEKIINILVPFLIAAVIAYILSPIVAGLEGKKIPRNISILLLYLLFSIIAVVVIICIIPAFLSNIRMALEVLPETASNFKNTVNNIMAYIDGSKWPHEIKNTAYIEIDTGILFAKNYLVEQLKRLMLSLINTVILAFDLTLAMIIAYYLLKDGDIFKDAFMSLTPRKWRKGIAHTGREINDILSHFIHGQLLTALIIGILEVLGLMLIKLKYPLLLGFIGGIANVIPYFGPILGAIPAIIVALMDSPLKALMAMGVFLIIQQLDNAFISPRIIEGKLGLHPVTTILVVLAGGEFFGVIGMLLAVPIAAIIKVVLKTLINSIIRSYGT